MKITKLVVHCSDTPDERDISAEDIHQWHKEKGWDGIGYHKVIKRDGTIENGRPDYWPGAHVRGYNSYSLGVCLIGRDCITSEQLVSLEKVIDDWLLKYPKAEIVGHCDLDPGKTCPNFDVQDWWSIVKDIRSYSQNGYSN
ncbi:N-acetylmuramoyl-L-alanine amidase [Spartinivicinus poritis]|uniref:N-acetylmuramoyl-L-alanine amidase n=1 Tax=Spartinivicinus poritis TaxID=2994640 RepID=A0ABT5UFP1_9GAMM|nr:N-acetylmuramoyl-L-alanine amidase [Spartinivicinus sp. A2-2]MDE1464806.1 N-acetylmuramoyl-L-alanine amidase [Spartinivicinus sp. A2-2]